MIRGPVLPQSREALWALVAGRLEAIERGLTLVAEGFDCSAGQLGLVDALARDVIGAPVLLLLVVEGDSLLMARAIAAADFLHRVGDALGSAVPEAAFCSGAPGRVIVIAVERCAAATEAFARQAIAGVQVCRLEPFRIAGSERFAVRWLATPGAVLAPAAPEARDVPAFVVPPNLQTLWSSLQEMCLRIDAGIKIDGDRYRRRITWNGRLLAEVHLVADVLQGTLVGGSPGALAAPADVRMFSDQLLRTYLRVAGLSNPRAADSGVGPIAARDPASRHAANGTGALMRPVGESLRATTAAARLTPEEYSALGEPTSAVGGTTDGAVTADDVARIVAAQESSWPLPGRPD